MNRLDIDNYCLASDYSYVASYKLHDLEEIWSGTAKIFVASNYCVLLDSFGLMQRVFLAQHTMVVAVKCKADALLADFIVSDYITDHAAIHCSVKMSCPAFSSKLIKFRKLKSIDMEKFANDIASLDLACK